MKIKIYISLIFIVLFSAVMAVGVFGCDQTYAEMQDCTFVYDGLIKTPVTTDNNLTFKYFLNGEEVMYAIDVGEYVVKAYSGSRLIDSCTMTIEKAIVQITAYSRIVDFDGTAKHIIPFVSQNILDATFTITYNGSIQPPSDTGTYDVEIELVSKNYYGSTNAKLKIIDSRVITLSDKTVTYSGEEVSVKVQEEEFEDEIIYLYNGLPSLPISAGEYDVKAYFENNSKNYTTAKLIILRSEVEISASDITVFEGDEIALDFHNTLEKEMTVTFDGNAETPSEPGEYLIEIFIDEANYFGYKTAILTIRSESERIKLTSLHHVYNGEEHSVEIANDNILNYTVLYDDSSAFPVNAGSYNVQAVHKINGSVLTGILIIEKATVTITAKTLTKIYNGKSFSLNNFSNALELPMDIVIYADGLIVPEMVYANTYTVLCTINLDNYYAQEEFTVIITTN